MSKLDKVIAIGLLVAIGATTGAIAAFYAGVYSPIKHDMGDVSGFNKKGLRVAENASSDVLQLGLDTYNPQKQEIMR